MSGRNTRKNREKCDKWNCDTNVLTTVAIGAMLCAVRSPVERRPVGIRGVTLVAADVKTSFYRRRRQAQPLHSRCHGSTVTSHDDDDPRCSVWRPLSAQRWEPLVEIVENSTNWVDERYSRSLQRRRFPVDTKIRASLDSHVTTLTLSPILTVRLTLTLHTLP